VELPEVTSPEAALIGSHVIRKDSLGCAYAHSEAWGIPSGVRMRNRKLRNIRPSRAFSPGPDRKFT